MTLVSKMIWLILLLSDLNASGASLGCSVHYAGEYHGLVADCSLRNLRHVPKDLSKSILVLNLNGNNLTTLPACVFQTYTQLINLDLSDNNISVFDEDSFKGLSKLVSLDLKRNSFAFDSHALPFGLFKSLKALQYLDLSESKSVSHSGAFPDSIFKPLGELEELSVDIWPVALHRDGFVNLRSLRKLNILGSCHLEMIDNNTFTALENLPLVSLNTGCYVTHVDVGALRVFHSLKRLVFKTSYSSSLSLSNVTVLLKPFVGSNMTEINFSGLQSIRKSFLTERTLNKLSMKYLLDICVENVDLSDNRLTTISLDILNTRFSECVKFLCLSLNRITGHKSMLWNLYKFRSLVSIDLSYNKKIHKTKNLLFGPAVYIPCPANLQEILYVSSGSSSFYNGNITFLNCTNVVKMDLSSSGTYGINGYVIGLSRVKYLDMSSNTMYESFFSNVDIVDSLETFIAKRSIMKFDITTSTSFLKMKNLRHLDLSSTGLQTIRPNSFRQFRSLQSLTLRGNRFDNIPDEITHVLSLTTLIMSENSLRIILPDTRSKLDHFNEVHGRFKLSLKGNLFLCSCASLDFITWTEETRVKLDVNRNYSCIKYDGSMTNTKLFYIDYLHQWRKCIGQSLLTTTMTAIFILILSLTTLFLIEKYFPKIEHFVLNIFGYNANEPLQRNDFKYDAYICYDSTDYQWPCHCLLKELQNLDRNIRLYLPDLHELPGESKAESIIEAISNSWKVVIVISEKSFTDEWLYFAIVSAVRLFSSHNAITSRIILLYKDHSPEVRARIPTFLANVLAQENVFTATERDTFWLQFHRMIIQDSGPDALF